MANILTSNFVKLLDDFTPENFPEFLWDNFKKKAPLKNNFAESIIIDNYSGKTSDYIKDSIKNIFLFWQDIKIQVDSITFYFFTADGIYLSPTNIFPEHKRIDDGDSISETEISYRVYKLGSMEPVWVESRDFKRILVTFTRRIVDAKNILSKIRIDKSFNEKQSQLTTGVNLNAIV